MRSTSARALNLRYHCITILYICIPWIPPSDTSKFLDDLCCRCLWPPPCTQHLQPPKQGSAPQREVATLMRRSVLSFFLMECTGWLLFAIPYMWGYSTCRYDIGNCLFEAAYQEVLTTCGCTPYFHWGNVQLDFILQKRPFCKVSSRANLPTID